MEINKIHNIDCLAGLKLMESKSVNSVVTSPPYWNLRDYGVKGQLGLEKTPKLFIKSLVVIFREIKRVLRDDGTVWLNMGDSYAAAAKSRTSEQACRKSGLNGGHNSQIACKDQKSKLIGKLKAKDLVGIPWMLAFALRDDGWYLRQDIIWHKTTSMPESVTDRCTKNHEYIFLLTKKPKYYYDHIAIMQDAKNPADDIRRLNDQTWDNKTSPDEMRNGLRPKASSTFKRENSKRGAVIPGQQAATHRPDREDTFANGKANKRSVWTVTPRSFVDAHFATYPQELIIDCIKAGSSEYGYCTQCSQPYKRYVSKNLVPTNKASFNSKADSRDFNADLQDAGSNRVKDGHKPGWINAFETLGWVPSCKCANTKRKPGLILDPFMGAGTTALVAQKLNRNFIGFELNPKYVEMANKRLNSHLGMFSPENLNLESANQENIKQKSLYDFLEGSDLNKVLSNK